MGLKWGWLLYFEGLDDLPRKIRGVDETLLLVGQSHGVLQKQYPVRQIHLAHTHITGQLQLPLVIALAHIIPIPSISPSPVPD